MSYSSLPTPCSPTALSLLPVVQAGRQLRAPLSPSGALHRGEACTVNRILDTTYSLKLTAHISQFTVYNNLLLISHSLQCTV